MAIGASFQAIGCDDRFDRVAGRVATSASSAARYYLAAYAGGQSEGDVRRSFAPCMRF
jgi:hypothetical protein